jgi:hypothetical protein
MLGESTGGGRIDPGKSPSIPVPTGAPVTQPAFSKLNTFGATMIE